MKLSVLLITVALFVGAAGTIHAQAVYPGPASASDSVIVTAGQDVTLTANPDPTNAATIITVTISGDAIGGDGTITLVTTLNGDGSVSGTITGGPPGQDATVCIGGPDNCILVTFDEDGNAFFTLFPAVAASLPLAGEALPGD